MKFPLRISSNKKGDEDRGLLPFNCEITMPYGTQRAMIMVFSTPGDKPACLISGFNSTEMAKQNSELCSHDVRGHPITAFWVSLQHFLNRPLKVDFCAMEGIGSSKIYMDFKGLSPEGTDKLVLAKASNLPVHWKDRALLLEVIDDPQQCSPEKFLRLLTVFHFDAFMEDPTVAAI